MPDETSIVDTEAVQTDALGTVALSAELETWRKRMFRRLIPARDHFPALYQLATGTEPPAKWAVRDYPPIRTFLLQALDHAQQVRGSGQPVDAYSPAVLRCIFGLTDDTMNATVKERQEAASALIPDLYTHYEMTEPEVRGPQVEALIAAIHGWCTARRTASTTAPVGRDGASTPWTRGTLFGRAADLEWLAQTRNRLKETGGVFGIWGLDGIGKTALAEQFAWSIGLERTATIRVRQPGHYAEDLRATLTRAGHAVPDAAPEQYEAAFRRHVSSLGNLWLLILDGVTDPGALDRLGLADAHIPVLVVANERFTAGHDQPGRMPWRHVAPLAREPSYHLMTQHLADPSSIHGNALDNLKGLASLMGGHAATLDAVSRLLPDLTEQDIADVLTQVGRTPGESLASLTRFTGDRELRAVAKPLSWIIRNKLAQLADDPVARTVLTVVVTCSDTGQLLREFIDPVVTDLLGRTPWSRELDIACDRLAQMGLATLDGDEVSTERLVCHLARYEVLDQATAALLAYERVVAEPAVPWSSEQHQLNYRRRVYEIASHYGRGNEAALVDPANSRLVLIDDGYIAHYITGQDGIRRVTLYRILASGMMLRLNGPEEGWTPIYEDQFHRIEPMVDAFFDILFNATLDPASLEARFGPDQSQWPTTVLEAVEKIDAELAEKLKKVDPELK